MYHCQLKAFSGFDGIEWVSQGGRKYRAPCSAKTRKKEKSMGGGGKKSIFKK